MRKDQLVRALTRVVKRQQNKSRNTPPAKPAKSISKAGSNGSQRKAGKANGSAVAPAHRNRQTVVRVRKKTPQVVRRIEEVHAQRERLKDLSTNRVSPPTSPVAAGTGESIKVNSNAQRDRLVLLVRDPYWLHACWEISRQSFERVRVAMAEAWHTARPVLRLMEVETGSTTSTAERVLREIPIHGGVNNWYIEAQSPPSSFRVAIGYLGSNGKFHALARSNAVTTPRPGSSDALDQNWSDVARDYERIYAMSGGYNDEPANGDLKELFEERLRRPMNSPLGNRYGSGTESLLPRMPNFNFEVDAELIIYGQTRPDAHVAIAGQPVKLRPDGTFTVRQALPDRRQVLPVVAGSRDGLEQRTVILAVERNTKIMEPLTREVSE